VALGFLTSELSRWDALAAAPGGGPELLALPFFSDERPLRGAAGLADWRMCGRLSRLLSSGRVAGEFGETTLLPGAKLPFPRLLLFGLGESTRFDEPRFTEAARALRKVVGQLGASRWALPLPGRSTGVVRARRALELWMAAGDGGGEVTLIDAPAGQKEMSEGMVRGPQRTGR